MPQVNLYSKSGLGLSASLPACAPYCLARLPINLHVVYPRLALFWRADRRSCRNLSELDQGFGGILVWPAEWLPSQ